MARGINSSFAINSSRSSTYEPQQQFLALIGLGDGTAVGAKYGMALHNRYERTHDINDAGGEMTRLFFSTQFYVVAEAVH